jgi:hypothetical protein
MAQPHFISRTAETLRTFFYWFIRRKLALVIFFIFLLALPAYVLYITAILPKNSVLPILSEEKTAEKDTFNIPRDISAEMWQEINLVSSLEMERAFLKNRYALAANSDSVYMVLNLSDSTLDLEIKGVVVRSCPVTDIRTSRNLEKIDREDLLQWVSAPFELQHDLSTIPKIPYVIKAAPKDTLEAQAQSSKPMPVDTTSVYFTLYLNRNLVLEVEQSEPPVKEDHKVIEEYRTTKSKSLRQAAMKAVLHGRAPEQDIYIRVEVDQADARAIYRGIPVNASLVLKL